jgi:hypothetical protein
MFHMSLKAEDLNDPARFRHLLTLSYRDIVSFIFDYLRRNTFLTMFYWSICLIFLGLDITVRINITGYFELKKIIYHTLLGLIVFPVLIIPVHEILHIIPYLFSGARNIRVGMDLHQFIFYVTAHRYVASPRQFRLVAATPFIIISILSLILVFSLPGLWKWSFSLFLFVHATMCAGDFALLNYYFINKHRKIYTWDDADLKEAYFYEEL